MVLLLILILTTSRNNHLISEDRQFSGRNVAVNTYSYVSDNCCKKTIELNDHIKSRSLMANTIHDLSTVSIVKRKALTVRYGMDTA